MCLGLPLYIGFFRPLFCSFYRKFDVSRHMQIDNAFALLPRKFLHNI